MATNRDLKTNEYFLTQVEYPNIFNKSNWKWLHISYPELRTIDWLCLNHLFINITVDVDEIKQVRLTNLNLESEIWNAQ